MQIMIKLPDDLANTDSRKLRNRLKAG